MNVSPFWRRNTAIALVLLAVGAAGICAIAYSYTPRPAGAIWLPTAAMAFFGLLVVGFVLLRLQRRQRTAQDQLVKTVQRLAAGRVQDPPPLECKDPDWQKLATSIRALEEALGNRDRQALKDHLHLEAVVSSMDEGVLALDSQLHIVVANASARHMLHLPMTGIEQRSIDQFVRMPEFRQAIAKARETRQPTAVEFETRAPRRRILAMRVTPLSDSGADDLAIVLSDVTELRGLESMRRDFAANVSHEMKTPLAAIQAYAETLRLGALDEPENARRFLQQIEDQARLLDQQIRDLLHLARVESGRAGFDLVAVDLHREIEACVLRFRTEADSRKVKLSGPADAQPVSALADQVAVQAILDNLVSNAIRYTRPQGWVRLECAYRDTHAELSVSDNGIGIAPEHHQRIFERFYRVDKARSRDVGGTGLGLAIVKHTVQALGGGVELTSAPGQGSTFRILFRRA